MAATIGGQKWLQRGSAKSVICVGRVLARVRGRVRARMAARRRVKNRWQIKPKPAHQYLDNRIKARRYWYMATIELTRQAREQHDALPKTIKRRVERLVERLQGWPDVSGVKALSGNLAGRHRARTGDYRVQFHAERLPGENDWRLTVEKIGHRDGFYDE